MHAVTDTFQQNHWLLPEGIEDVLPDEARWIESLRRDLLNLFATWGYKLVIPPLIDFIDSLLTGTGYELNIQTFKLTDQLSGRTLGIRADMTPQVARIDAHNLCRNIPTRLCYIGTVLHTRGNYLDKSRSPIQVGAELYGHAGIESDLEVLRLMLEMLAIAGLSDVHIDLGHVGIYRSLVKQAGLNEKQESELFDVLQRKAGAEVNELLESYQLSEEMRPMLSSLINLNGDMDVIETAKQILESADQSVFQALSELESIADRLRVSFPLLPINFDLAELRGYHYQTGIVFAAFIPGYGREIARGGRYDDIGKMFGRARPATGFSSDLKMIAHFAQNDRNNIDIPSIYAPSIDDIDLQETIRDLRAAGSIVIQDLPGQKGSAIQMGCDSILEKKQHKWLVVPI